MHLNWGSSGGGLDLSPSPFYSLTRPALPVIAELFMAVAGASYGQYMGSYMMDLAAFMEERMSLGEQGRVEGDIFCTVGLGFPLIASQQGVLHE